MRRRHPTTPAPTIDQCVEALEDVLLAVPLYQGGSTNQRQLAWGRELVERVKACPVAELPAAICDVCRWVFLAHMLLRELNRAEAHIDRQAEFLFTTMNFIRRPTVAQEIARRLAA